MKEDTEVTLETLAQMVARGFQSVDERFDGVDKELAVLKGDVSGLKEDVAVLKGDVSGLKGDVAILKEDVADLQVGMSALQVTVDRIDMRTQNQADSLYSDMRALEGRVEVLEKG